MNGKSHLPLAAAFPHNALTIDAAQFACPEIKILPADALTSVFTSGKTILVKKIILNEMDLR